MAGPLAGIRIIELAGIGPGPFAAMMLADHGAEVIRIERGGELGIPNDPLLRGRRTLRLNLKSDAGRDVLLRLAKSADGLIDPFRPGRLEALNLGPDVLHDVNAGLVIGRLTGWGQHGPMSQRAGHDINYLALSGLLLSMGSGDGRPLPPSNLVADYAGGAMMLAFSMAACLREVAAGAGEGRVIDCAMSEGSALLGSFLFAMTNMGLRADQRESSLLDGGAGLYGTYKTSDGYWLSVGSIEPQFRAQLVDRLGLAGDDRFDDSLDPSRWREQRAVLEEVFAAQPLQHWLDLFEDSDACVAPVLSMAEAAAHPHHVARWAFFDSKAGPVPAPAPRYGKAPEPPAENKSGGAQLLAELGYDAEEIASILEGE